MRKLSLIIMGIFLISLVSAQLIFKQYDEIDLKLPCSFNGTFCNTSAVCNITIMYPNGSAMVDNQEMTNSGNGVPNYTLPDETITGTYSCYAFCEQAGESDSDVFEFKITASGDELSTSQGIIYVIVLLIAIGLFAACLYGAFKVRWSNFRGDDGRIVSINDIKYLKIVCAVFSYIAFIWVVGLVHAITNYYLHMDFASKFFNMIYMGLLACLLPSLILSVIIGLVVWFDDKKIGKLIDRGLRVMR